MRTDFVHPQYQQPPFWDPILVGLGEFTTQFRRPISVHHFGVGEFTTHCRTYFSGWIESAVHWGWIGSRSLIWRTDLAFEKPMATSASSPIQPVLGRVNHLTRVMFTDLTLNDFLKGGALTKWGVQMSMS